MMTISRRGLLAASAVAGLPWASAKFLTPEELSTPRDGESGKLGVA
jgi:hypothetical protein